MAGNNTLLAQVPKCVPGHEFEKLAKEHHRGRAFRSASRWSQFTALVMAQLSGRSSLLDITAILSAQAHRLYHLGSTRLTRSTLARLNAEKPYMLYPCLFEGSLINQRSLCLLSLSLFEKRDLMALLCTDPPPTPNFNPKQLVITVKVNGTAIKAR